MSVAVENPPVIDEAAATPGTLQSDACGTDSAAVRAVVRDESEVVTVDLTWSVPDGEGTVAMVLRSGGWHARLGSFTQPGPVTWHVVATDARGNTATGPQLVLTVEPCPVVRNTLIAELAGNCEVSSPSALLPASNAPTSEETT